MLLLSLRFSGFDIDHMFIIYLRTYIFYQGFLQESVGINNILYVWFVDWIILRYYWGIP